MGQDATAQVNVLEDSSSLSNDALKKLNEMKLSYPGWEMDFEDAFDSYEAGDKDRFKISCRKLDEKQRVFDDYKSFNRLKALVALVLTYPGSEQDLQSAEEWHIKNISNEENNKIFQDKLDGMQNKENLYVGDRTHPNIVALDNLEFTYPGWEGDYQHAMSELCEAPSARFPDAFHALRERQRVFSGDRSHWRLVQLDTMKLSYPGWEEDVKEVEDWHFQNAVNDVNNSMFNEVLEGVKDQQMICMGWEHDSTDAPSIDRSISDLDNNSTQSQSTQSQSESSYSSRSTCSAHGSFYKLEKQADPAEIKASYMSISESLKMHEQKKKQLMEERSLSRPKPETEARPPARPPAKVLANRSRVAPRPAPRLGNSNANNEGSDKQVDLGKCVVCMNRTKTHVFVPCGHLCACAACGSRAMKTTAVCPICREAADRTFRVFLT